MIKITAIVLIRITITVMINLKTTIEIAGDRTSVHLKLSGTSTTAETTILLVMLLASTTNRMITNGIATKLVRTTVIFLGQ